MVETPRVTENEDEPYEPPTVTSLGSTDARTQGNVIRISLLDGGDDQPSP